MKKTIVLVVLVIALGVYLWFSEKPPKSVPAPQTNTQLVTPTPTPIAVDPRATALSTFFTGRHCPEINFSLIPDYVAVADQYKIDYRLLPAISVQESTCAEHYPVGSGNIWGWNSARTRFTSLSAGLDFIAQQLSESPYYVNKTTTNTLRAYNHNPAYAGAVEQLMKEISNEQL